MENKFHEKIAEFGKTLNDKEKNQLKDLLIDSISFNENKKKAKRLLMELENA